MTIEEYKKQIKAAQKATEEADISASNKLYDDQKKAVEDVYGQKIGDTAESYDDAYKKNETQRFVNSRALERRMAEMGLTDSGLNRTQQTALQLSYGNQNANITMQKQKAIDTLAAAMSSEVAGIESKKLAEAQNIRSAYDEAALTGAKELYKNEQDNLAKIESEMVKNSQQLTERFNSDSEKLHAHLQENSDNLDYAAQLIDAYCTKYDIDPTTQQGNAQLTALLKSAGISLNEYKHYLSNGSVYATAAQYNSGDTSGRTRWNYKTDGKQKYKIEVVNDTINWGWGVDGNATVKIYYADGTPITNEPIKLSSLSRDVAKQITKLTKGSGNEGKTEYLTIDLSKENLG